MAKIAYNTKELIELKKLIDWALSTNQIKSLEELRKLRSNVPEGKVLIKLLYQEGNRFNPNTEYYGRFIDELGGRVVIEGIIGFTQEEKPKDDAVTFPQTFPRYGGVWGFNIYNDGQLVISNGCKKYIVKEDFRDFKTGDILFGKEGYEGFVKIFAPHKLVGNRIVHRGHCDITIASGRYLELLPDDYDLKSITTEVRTRIGAFASPHPSSDYYTTSVRRREPLERANPVEEFEW